jgi:CBS domain-containing protein
VYDYVDGKAAWMGEGLPVEGEEGPFLRSVVSEVATCDAGLTVDAAREALARSPFDLVVIVSGGLAVGEVGGEVLEGRGGDEPLLEVMKPVPSTVRPSVPVAAVVEAGGGALLVSTSAGRLLGLADVESDGDHHHHE